MHLLIHLIVSLLAVAMGNPATRPPLRPEPRNGDNPATRPPFRPEPRNWECADMPDFMQNADRIVGGEKAPSMIPWQVALLNGNWQFCGATILDASTVLCAAHCEPKLSHSVRVSSTDKTTGGQKIAISKVIYNENSGFKYNPTTLENDFVILKLASPLTLNDDVKPACLPSSSSYLDTSSTEERCFTSGWGTLSSGGSSTDNLMYVRVPAITNEVCNESYNGDITDSMICAGYPGEGGKDACQGDSGGPFVCNDNGKAVIAGVVSWGNGCALASHPGVYARTTHILEWIKSQMGNDGGPPAPPPAPTTAGPTQGPPDGCGAPQWFGDNYCDDENNNFECGYDGGDCCGDNVNTQYCSECECLEIQETTQGPDESTTVGPTQGPGSCIDHWIGDDYCDDENNNNECGYDGGDCCGDNVNTEYCSECECLEFQETTQAPGSNCELPFWFGDNYCDDENNNSECGYDGGDCCGDDVNTMYCSECVCLE